jgi:DNA-binding MarR family transcriptional regulator
MAARDRETLSRDTYLNLVRVHEQLVGEFDALFRERGLTQTQYNVLRILRGGPREGYACQAIGERLLTRVPDVTRLIDRMEKAGLVTRSRGAEDRRVVLIRLTAKGRKVCDALDGPVLELHRSQFPGVARRHLRDLNELLQEVLASS